MMMAMTPMAVTSNDCPIVDLGRWSMLRLGHHQNLIIHETINLHLHTKDVRRYYNFQRTLPVDRAFPRQTSKCVEYHEKIHW